LERSILCIKILKENNKMARLRLCLLAAKDKSSAGTWQECRQEGNWLAFYLRSLKRLLTDRSSPIKGQ
jgi:hypothetical protein